MITDIIYRLQNNNDRREIRTELVTLFLNENPGTGTGENCNQYKYFVDTLENGNRIYLKRPARLNKGFDFEVHVENTTFSNLRRKTMPSHRNIYEDLIQKRLENANKFIQVRGFINMIYDCNIIPDDELRTINFEVGHSTETIIKAINWLFIEQDITYWNWSGRRKLYSFLAPLLTD